MIKAYLILTIVMFFVELVLFSYDKVASGDGRFRIPVYVLMIPIGFGGGLGALVGMLIYRHKTTKMFFKIPIYFSVIIQSILFIALLFVR